MVIAVEPDRAVCDCFGGLCVRVGDDDAVGSSEFHIIRCHRRRLCSPPTTRSCPPENTTKTNQNSGDTGIPIRA